MTINTLDFGADLDISRC